MYHYIQKAGEPGAETFIVFHGTGGDETDLISVAKAIAPDAQVIGVRGDVDENGALRFFKRIKEGQYDWKDLAERGQRLRTFLTELAEQEQFSLDQTYLLGFSNGANMAYHLMVEAGLPVKGAYLFAPMYPKDLPKDHIDLSGKRFFVSMGKADPIVPLAESKRVAKQLKSFGAIVAEFWVESHEISLESLQAAQVNYAESLQASQ